MDTNNEVQTCETVEQLRQEVAYRTSSNNMLCLVEYVPITAEEQAEIEEVFKVA